MNTSGPEALAMQSPSTPDRRLPGEFAGDTTRAHNVYRLAVGRGLRNPEEYILFAEIGAQMGFGNVARDLARRRAGGRGL
jgi:hypothetical protein